MEPDGLYMDESGSPHPTMIRVHRCKEPVVIDRVACWGYYGCVTKNI